MKKRASGFTVIELIIGFSVAAILGLVTASLVKAGLKTYWWTSRQNVALQSGSAAFKGKGSRMGMITQARASVSVATLGSSALVLVSTTGATTAFSISTGTLRQTPSSGSAYTLASDASTLALGYYNMDSSGRIMASTVAANATFVTALLSVTGVTNTKKTYYFYGGAQLRNHN